MSSSCLIVMMLCTALVSVHTSTKPAPRMPMKKSMAVLVVVEGVIIVVLLLTLAQESF